SFETVVTSRGPAASSTPSPRLLTVADAHSQRKSRPRSRGDSRSIIVWNPRPSTPASHSLVAGPPPRRPPASPWLVAGPPRGRPPLVEGGEPFAGLGAHALTGDDPGGVPLRRPVAQAADLADRRLAGAVGGRPGRQDVGDGRVDGRVQRGVAFDQLVDEADPLGADGVEPTAAGEQGPSAALAD